MRGWKSSAHAHQQPGLCATPAAQLMVRRHHRREPIRCFDIPGHAIERMRPRRSLRIRRMQEQRALAAIRRQHHPALGVLPPAGQRALEQPQQRGGNGGAITAMAIATPSSPSGYASSRTIPMRAHPAAPRWPSPLRRPSSGSSSSGIGDRPSGHCRVDPRHAWMQIPGKKKAPLARGLLRTASGNRRNQNLYCIDAASTSPVTLYLPTTLLAVAEVELMFGSLVNRWV